MKDPALVIMHPDELATLLMLPADQTGGLSGVEVETDPEHPMRVMTVVPAEQLAAYRKFRGMGAPPVSAAIASSAITAMITGRSSLSVREAK